MMNIRKQISVVVCVALVLSSFCGLLNKPIESKAVSYGLQNPTIINGVSTWDTIYFGRFLRDDTNGDGFVNETDEKKPIRWRVLSVNRSEAYLMADEILDAHEFDDNKKNEYWDSCTLRSWMNSILLYTAFNDKERMAITDTSTSYWSGVVNANITVYDKVCVPTIADMYNPTYGFNSDIEGESETRQAKVSDYFRQHVFSSTISEEFGGTGYWWLNNGGEFTKPSGEISNLGYGKDAERDFTNNYGVRPVIHLDLSATTLWSKGEKITSNGGGDITQLNTPEPVPSTFEILKDNNSYSHYASNEGASGFFLVKNYKIGSDYFSKLTKHSSKGEISDIKKYMNQKWNGSCYGIASTIGLVYNGCINVSDINDSGANCYYNLPKPKDDQRLLQSINYYQLSQNLKLNKVKAYRIASCYDKICPNNSYSDSLESCLRKIVETSYDGKVYMLAFSGQGGGHCILVTGCEYDTNNNCYNVQLYDENTVSKNSYGQFTTMTISNDFDKFNIQDELNETNYNSLDFFDLDKMALTLDHVSSDMKINSASDETKTTTLRFDLDKPFSMKNNLGQYINYNGQQIDSNMEIYNSYVSTDNEGEKIAVEIPYNDELEMTCSNNECDMDLINDEKYKSIEASGLKSVTIDMNHGMDMKGENIDFAVYSSTDSKVTDEEDSLVSVSGKSEGDVSVDCDTDVSVNATAGISNANTSIYSGTEETSKTFEGVVSNLKVDPVQKKVSSTTPSPTPTPTAIPVATPLSPNGSSKNITPTTTAPKDNKVTAKMVGKCTIHSIKNKSGCKIDIKLNKGKYINGYQIQYSISKKLKKSKSKQVAKNYYTIKKLKKKRLIMYVYVGFIRMERKTCMVNGVR